LFFETRLRITLMNDSSRVVLHDGPDTDELLDSLALLARRSEKLAGRLLAAVVEPLRRGLPPDQTVLDECRAIAAEYAVTVEAAVASGLPAGEGLGVMIATLRDRTISTRWERFRAGAVQLLADIGRLAHASGASPQYLADARERAAATKAELEIAHTGSDPASWESRLKPFHDLWRLLTGAELLSELEAEIALTQVEQAFGRAMMSAVATRKLVANSRPDADSQKAIENSPAIPTPA
jgi:hypothetical protein